MFLDTDGGLLNTVEFGAGNATFVAHGGWVGNWELWQDPFQLMQSRWRCLSYDHRGSGASTFPPESITPKALVDDLFRVLDHFAVDSCVLAGESLGALTCLQAVLREPARFQGLVLIDGVPAANEERSLPMVNGSRADFPATVRAFVDACVPEPDSEHIRRWGRQILLRAEPEAAARILECHYQEQVAPDLTAVSVPTLVLHGEHDRIIPVQAAEVVAAAIPQAELVVLKGVGHVPTLTRPQSVVDAIETWAETLPRR
jgi:pimeloyl-ACP methyl ester carboxylesterase